MEKHLLTLQNLRVTVAGREIINGVDWSLDKGDIKVLLGPNGAGKSTLAGSIAGLPAHQITGGQIFLAEKEINNWSLDERARAGIFLTWQEPVAIPGVRVSSFLREAAEKIQGKGETIFSWQTKLNKFCEQLQLSPTVLSRELGVGFSGGEKKKLELLQMLALQPQVVILDELDSGLDADAAGVARAVIRDYQEKTQAAFLIITHTGMIIEDLPVREVAVLRDGKIAERGGRELAEKIKHSGYANLESDDARTHA